MHLSCFMCLISFCGLCSAFFFWKDKGKAPIFCYKICPLYCPDDARRRHDTGYFYVDDVDDSSFFPEDTAPLDYEMFQYSRFHAPPKATPTTTMKPTTALKPSTTKYVARSYGAPWPQVYRDQGSDYFFADPPLDDYEYYPSLHQYVHFKPELAGHTPTPHPTTSTTTTTTKKPDPTFICELCEEKCKKK